MTQRHSASEDRVQLSPLQHLARKIDKFRSWWNETLFPAEDHLINDRTWCRAGLVVLTMALSMMLIPNLSYPLLEPDEGRYAQISREMLVSQDWITPTLYTHPYLDKPPLFYWLVTAAFSLFGPTPNVARLIPALAAMTTVLATFWFGSRILGTRAAFCSAVALGLSIGFLQTGRVLVIDMVLTMFVSLALLSSYEALRGPTLSWRWWVAYSIFCSLGVLTKGPIAIVLCVPPVWLFSRLSMTSCKIRITHWLAFGLVAAVVTGPWFSAVIVRNPEFLRHFFLKHHINRFLSNKYHPHPIWFYVPVCILGFMPWSFLLIPFVRFMRSSSTAAYRYRCLGFHLLWAGWCFIFFSLSRGKLPAYVLPCFPAMSLMLGPFLDSVMKHFYSDQRTDPMVQRASRCALAVLCGAAAGVNVGTWFLRLPGRSEYMLESGLWALGIVGMVFYGRKLPSKVLYSLCLVTLIAVNVESAHRLVPAWATQHSPLVQSPKLHDLLQRSDLSLACYGREWGGVAFEFQGRTLLNFSHRPKGDITDFFRQHETTILLIKNTAKLQWVKDMLPENRQIRQIDTLHNATVSIVEPRKVTAQSISGGEPRKPSMFR